MRGQIVSSMCLFLVIGMECPILAAPPVAGKVGERYRKTCAHCHQSPDLRFATDLAWLDQIRRTA